jgi:hypothetical protein
MDESQIVDIWGTFKEYIEKKNLEAAAERFIDLCADYGVPEETLTSAIGSCAYLDQAINYYLELDSDGVLDEEMDWD